MWSGTLKIKEEHLYQVSGKFLCLPIPADKMQSIPGGRKGAFLQLSALNCLCLPTGQAPVKILGILPSLPV